MPDFRTALLVAVLLLTACESTPTRVFTYGSRGVEIQAQRLVASVYGLPADPLPYGGANIDGPLQRMQERWSELKALLDQGVIGITIDGEIAIRDSSALDSDAARKLKALVKAENRDRDLIYRTMTGAVGYGGDMEPLFLPFTEDAFGAEWLRQAPAGWWMQDLQGRWQRK